jgi:hypothetical protein
MSPEDYEDAVRNELADKVQDMIDPSEATRALVLKTDTRYKAATFIETYTGRAFWPLQPTMEALSVIDIAHALSNQCRYTGHVQHFYSVAQHCCLLATWVANRGGSALDCLQILMHDAPEAYLVDIARPVKQYMPEYRVWDHAINDVVREWMGWKDLPMLPIQDEIDSRIIVDERAQLMDKARRNDWGHNLEPLGIRIEPWSPESSEKQFLMQYAAYSKEVYGTYQYINDEWGIPVRILHAGGGDMISPTDFIEVDVRGGVGRVKVRDDDGILVRDETGGRFPRGQWRWEHGKFELREPGNVSP